MVSQFMHAPQTRHSSDVYRIIGRLKKSPGQGVLYANHGRLDTEIYVDAD